MSFLLVLANAARDDHEGILRSDYQANSRDISKLGAECVNAPNEMKSTPVAATAARRCGLVPILPDASISMLGEAWRTTLTAACIVSTSILSSSHTSAPASKARCTSATVSHSPA